MTLGERAKLAAVKTANAALELVNPTPPETPDPPAPADVAPTIGWRDEPYTGEDVCSPCDGWGVRRRWIRKVGLRAGEPGYLDGGLRTCDFCGGTGRKRPA